MSIVIGNKDSRNKGIATEAIYLLLKAVFEEMKLHKIELNVYDDNKAAIKCYQKNGFIIEGEKRDHMLINDKYHNLIQMGILESEYWANK